jgi:hypothetical protein
MNKKYTFHQYIAAIEGDDFDNITEDNLKWADQFIDAFPKIMKTELHYGDCTNVPCTCTICIYRTLLLEYEEYYFNEEEWRKVNL